MDAWENAESVILIDAAHSGANTGTIHRFDALSTEIPSGLFHYSSHQFAVAEAIEMARILGRLPKAMTVYGIEGTDFSYGEGLSPAVSDAIDKVAGEILLQIRKKPETQ